MIFILEYTTSFCNLSMSYLESATKKTASEYTKT